MKIPREFDTGFLELAEHRLPSGSGKESLNVRESLGAVPFCCQSKKENCNQDMLPLCTVGIKSSLEKKYCPDPGNCTWGPRQRRSETPTKVANEQRSHQKDIWHLKVGDASWHSCQPFMANYLSLWNDQEQQLNAMRRKRERRSQFWPTAL